ncbi:hypothetical protein VP1G_07545 [Cytospora mali]|uniref:Uncharacterized protein n=1 Tax=Cytospora mali TaxID=578113 RepID=A0A194V8K6_CYTMA|nr:hypothetical protein VP1G_07545 [Valsa mali var. pyri (nom. inval.)]
MPRTPGKRSGGPPQASSDPPTAKKVKREEEADGAKESIFAAARRRHEVRTGQAQGGAVAGSSGSETKAKTKPEGAREGAAAVSGVESYAEWERRWKAVYPGDLVRAVGAVRRLLPAAVAGVTGAATSVRYVYVVAYLVHGQYIDTEHDVVGAYATAASANERAMVFILKEYPHFTNPVNYNPDEHIDKDEFVWNVDSVGCFSLNISDEDGDHKAPEGTIVETRRLYRRLDRAQLTMKLSFVFWKTITEALEQIENVVEPIDTL